MNEFCTLDLTEQELEKDKATDMCRAEGDEGSQQTGRSDRRSNQSILSKTKLFCTTNSSRTGYGSRGCGESHSDAGLIILKRDMQGL